MPTELVVVDEQRALREPRHGSIVPVPYDEATLPALRMARSSRRARKLAAVLMAALAGAVVLMLVAPWQQSVTASGNVIAYAPLERQQVIEAPIKGRIVRLGDNIFENAKVKKGAVIAEIQDLDEDYAGRLVAQMKNSEDQVAAAKLQLDASKRSYEAALTVTHAYEAQVIAYQTVYDDTILAQNAYVTQAEEKVRAEERQLEEYNAAIPQLAAEYERSKSLHAQGTSRSRSCRKQNGSTTRPRPKSAGPSRM